MTKPKRKKASAADDSGRRVRRAHRKAKQLTTGERLSAALKGVRDDLRKDAGLSGDADRLPQLTWLLFLKGLDDFDREREVLYGDRHESLIEAPYRWRDWASNPDQTKRPTGDDLIAFVNGELIPYLGRLAGTRARDLRSIIGKIFAENPNRIRSGTIMREVVDRLSNIDFTATEDTYTVSLVYESMLREMRDAAGDSGEFYTPRPVVKFIVDRLAPKLGERVLDPACGTCGFLVEAYEHQQEQARTPKQQRQLWECIIGVEKKPMPYLLGVMNLMLHGVEEPNVVEFNALSQNIQHIRDEDRVEVIATNPPFGGEEERGILNNFPADMRTAETALLFFQHIMARLNRPRGRCGVVLPVGFLSGTGVATQVKRKLLTEFNLHTIVRLPNGVFSPYTDIPTNLLFFNADERGVDEPTTKHVWYYELPLPAGRKNYSKTKPLRYEEFSDCLAWWDNRSENAHAWRVSFDELAAEDFDLNRRNPKRVHAGISQKPTDVIGGISSATEELRRRITEIDATLAGIARTRREPGSGDVALGDLVSLIGGGTPTKGNPTYWDGATPWISPKDMKTIEIFDSKDHITDEAIENSAAKLIEPGAVLIVTRGMILARTVPVSLLRVPACINQDMKALVPCPRILPEYLCAALWIANADLLALVERSTHDTRKLETHKLLRFSVPLPALEMQRELAAEILKLQRQIAELSQARETIVDLISLLEPSLSSAAFDSFKGIVVY